MKTILENPLLSHGNWLFRIVLNDGELRGLVCLVRYIIYYPAGDTQIVEQTPLKKLDYCGLLPEE